MVVAPPGNHKVVPFVQGWMWRCRKVSERGAAWGTQPKASLHPAADGMTSCMQMSPALTPPRSQTLPLARENSFALPRALLGGRREGGCCAAGAGGPRWQCCSAAEQEEGATGVQESSESSAGTLAISLPGWAAPCRELLHALTNRLFTQSKRTSMITRRDPFLGPNAGTAPAQGSPARLLHRPTPGVPCKPDRKCSCHRACSFTDKCQAAGSKSSQ